MSENGRGSEKILLDSPYSQEAEEAVIGAALINPIAYLTVSQFLKADDFFFLRHSYLWQAMTRLHERRDPIDNITLAKELQGMGVLNEIGGPALLTQLITNTPTSIHAEVYGRLVQRTAVRRRLMKAADAIKAVALDESLNIEEVEAKTDGIYMGTKGRSDNTFVTFADAVNEHFDRVEKAMENPGTLLGIESIIPDVNTMLRGYQPKRLYVGAGRPGMGKSSWLQTEAANMVAKGLSVAFFTLEVGYDELTGNIIGGVVNVNAETMTSGEMQPAEFSRYVSKTQEMATWKLFIDDTSGITPAQLRARCMLLSHEHGLDAVFVDYLQLMSGGHEVHYTNRDQEIGYISRSLKALSKELNVPVIAAAQLSRAVEQRQDKRPTLSDLRESGNIENDADVVLFFYRADYYDKDNEPPEISIVEIGIGKARQGKTGHFKFGFWGKLKKFVQLAKEVLR